MAVKSNYSARFYDAAVLLTELEKAAREGMLEAKLKEINRYQPRTLVAGGGAHLF